MKNPTPSERTTPSQVKRVINITLILIIVILLVQNLSLTNVNFLFFSMRMPLLLLIAGVFFVGWYTSKYFGGKFNVSQMKSSFDSVEDSLGNVVGKGIEETKDIAEKAQHFAAKAQDKMGELANKTMDMVDKAKGNKDEKKDDKKDEKKSSK